MTVSEAIWLKGQLKGLGFCHTSVIQIYCDNTSTIQIAKNRIFHKCNKRTEINCHFIRDKIKDGNVSTHHVPSQGASCRLTKALKREQHYYLLQKYGMKNIFAVPANQNQI